MLPKMEDILRDFIFVEPSRNGTILLVNQKSHKKGEFAIFPKLIYRSSAILIKIPDYYFAEIDKLVLKFIWKQK